MSRTISAEIFSGESRKVSSVCSTAPSVLFSTGTTPKSARPCSTSAKTPAMVPTGSARAERPNWWVTAMCVNVASGPR
jgi:hypothetical protein